VELDFHSPIYLHGLDGDKFNFSFHCLSRKRDSSVDMVTTLHSDDRGIGGRFPAGERNSFPVSNPAPEGQAVF